MFELKNIRSKFKAINKTHLFNHFTQAKTPLNDLAIIFEPFEERLKSSNKYLNGNKLTFEDCDFVIGMRYIKLTFKCIAYTELFMDYPYITKFINEVQKLPAHDIANHYHLGISTNRFQNDSKFLFFVLNIPKHMSLTVYNLHIILTYF